MIAKTQQAIKTAPLPDEKFPWHKMIHWARPNNNLPSAASVQFNITASNGNVTATFDVGLMGFLDICS